MVRRHAGNVNTASRNRGDAPMERLLEQTAPRRPKPSDSLSKWALIIGAGILATSLPQIADSRLDLPLKNVLTQELHLGLKDVTDFFVFAIERKLHDKQSIKTVRLTTLRPARVAAAAPANRGRDASYFAHPTGIAHGSTVANQARMELL